MIAVKVLKLNWTISSILNQINLIEKNFETFVIIKTLYRDRADRKKLWKGKTESKQNSKVKLCLIEKDDITEFINCTLEWETSSQSVWFMLPNLEIGINKLRLVFQEGICRSVWALIPLQKVKIIASSSNHLSYNLYQSWNLIWPSIRNHFTPSLYYKSMTNIFTRKIINSEKKDFILILELYQHRF